MIARKIAMSTKSFLKRRRLAQALILPFAWRTMAGKSKII
jgi:hypothetical protein